MIRQRFADGGRGWITGPVHRGLAYRLRLLAWFVVWFLVGSACAFGPLDLGFSLFTLLTGTVLGLTMALLLSRALTSRLRREEWRWRFLWPARLALLFLLIVVALQLYSTGALPSLTNERVGEFDRLMAALSAHYPYLEQKERSLSELNDTFRGRVESASSDEQYMKIIGEMLAGFHDGQTYAHVHAVDQVGDVIRIGRVERIGGEYIVTQLDQSVFSAELMPGTALLARDGREIDQYIAELAPWLTFGSTSQSRERRALDQLFSVQADKAAQFTVRTPAGEILTIEVSGNVAAGSIDEPLPPIQVDMLTSDIGYIAVNTFAFDVGMGKRLDRAMDEVAGTQALIIDLRQNKGGRLTYAHRLAGRFLADPFAYGRITFRHRLPHFGWRLRETLEVRPRGELYSGTVVVLTGTETRHAAEVFAMALKDSGRAIIVGDVTAGEVGIPITFRLPGGKAQFTVGSLHRFEGPSVEGRGLEPDVLIRPTLRQIVLNEDAVLQWAIDYLK